MGHFCVVLDVDRFLVRDVESETKFRFDLATSLEKASSNRLLDGYRIHVTSNVKPEPKQMKGDQKNTAELKICPVSLNSVLIYALL